MTERGITQREIWGIKATIKTSAGESEIPVIPMSDPSTYGEVKEFFLNDKPVAALVAVHRINDPMGGEQCYGRKISMKIDSTYAHTVKTLAKMRDLGLIQTEKKGRKKVHSLTEEGQEYAEIFESLLHKIGDDFGGDDLSIDLRVTEREAGATYPPKV